MKLYTYWRSQAAFRVRIALNLKRVKAEMIYLDLLQGEQFADDYRRLNPHMAVPTLIDGDGPPLLQSLAIIEYLEERYPDPPLLPRDARERAHVKSLALVLAADSHPFVTPRVRNYLEQELHLDGPTRIKWILHWMMAGLDAVEAQLARDARTGLCCLGDTPTIADLCLVPHMTTIKIFPHVDFGPYPIARRIYEHCMTLEAFKSAEPARQPDAPQITSR